MIRPVTQDDAGAVSALGVSSGLFPPEGVPFLDKMMADFFERNIHEGYECVVDVENDEFFGVVYYEPALATDRTWYLTMIAVRGDQQGKGRGAALMPMWKAPCRGGGSASYWSKPPACRSSPKPADFMPSWVTQKKPASVITIVQGMTWCCSEKC